MSCLFLCLWKWLDNKHYTFNPFYTKSADWRANCLIYSQCTHMQRFHSQFYESVFGSLISCLYAEIFQFNWSYSTNNYHVYKHGYIMIILHIFYYSFNTAAIRMVKRCRVIAGAQQNLYVNDVCGATVMCAFLHLLILLTSIFYNLLYT